ncbi:lipopolysaccharide assembly protein LapB [Lewinella sp. 4G2]|uniref:tetratricopeptide repeat protein n=1 Tax=Lewinella sp. 4G2 TaxID=1803372 RepID=UPI0007B491EF|nr:tetratricopeptide repeat protein [Lewinella sp. 4G2]OAV45163.1 hypothetical protein A3850_011970 [Lewinella sp. 4G2]
MTEQQLLKEATDLYHQEGREAEAITAFRKLLAAYPKNSEAWAHLSTMCRQIGDYDAAISAIDRAISLAPEDAWLNEQKGSLLASIARMPAESQHYFDERTREAFLITAYPTKSHLLLALDRTLEHLLHLMEKAGKPTFKPRLKLAMSKTNIGAHKDAITILTGLLDGPPPPRMNPARWQRQRLNLDNHIANNLVALGRYAAAETRYQSVMTNQKDNYLTGLQLVKLYEASAEPAKRKGLLQQLYSDNEARFKRSPEPAFLFRKIALLRALDEPNRLKELEADFAALPTDREYNQQAIKEMRATINEILGDAE